MSDPRLASGSHSPDFPCVAGLSFAMTTKPKSKPWMKSNPKKKAPTKLTKASKTAAEARARKAGRPYPNLIDNMWAAQQQKRKPASTD